MDDATKKAAEQFSANLAEMNSLKKQKGADKVSRLQELRSSNEKILSQLSTLNYTHYENNLNSNRITG